MGAISSHALCNGTTKANPPPPQPTPPIPNGLPNGQIPHANGPISAPNGLSAAPAATPPPPPPPPPVAPPPPPAPPAPGCMTPPHHTDAMTIKRKVDTKYKLPTLNWIALKPNQVRPFG